MSFELKRGKNGRKKKSRVEKKYPRAAIKRLDEDTVPIQGMKKCHKNRDYSYISWSSVEKFLKSRKGKPIDDVFSEFTQLCKKSNIFNAKEIFDSHIQKDEEYEKEFGGCYISNGILNYKSSNWKSKYKSQRSKREFDYKFYVKWNKSHLPSIDKIKEVCEKTVMYGRPVFLGKFYIYIDKKYELKSIFVARYYYIYYRINGYCVNIPGLNYGFEIKDDGNIESLNNTSFDGKQQGKQYWFTLKKGNSWY